MKVHKNVISLSIVLLMGLLSCVKENDNSIERSLAAVESCIRLWELVSEAEISREIDRAYVHLYGEGFGVIFAKGEIGTFGKRSKNFQIYFNCVAASENPLEIYYLGVPPYEPLFELTEQLYEEHYRNAYTSLVLEFLILRNENNFTFEKSHIFDAREKQAYPPVGEGEQ